MNKGREILAHLLLMFLSICFYIWVITGDDIIYNQSIVEDFFSVLFISIPFILYWTIKTIYFKFVVFKAKSKLGIFVKSFAFYAFCTLLTAFLGAVFALSQPYDPIIDLDPISWIFFIMICKFVALIIDLIFALINLVIIKVICKA